MGKRGRTYGSRNAILRELGFSSYREYLASDLWKRIRTFVLERDSYLCRMCHRPANQVHHQHYDKPVLLGRKMHSLVSTCGACHKWVEFTGSGKKRSVFWARRMTRNLLEESRSLERDQHQHIRSIMRGD